MRVHVLFSFAILSLSVGALDAQQVQGLDPNEIPIEVRVEVGMQGKIRQEHQQGTVKAYSLRRIVSIDWESSSITNQPPDYDLRWDLRTGALGNALISHSSQEVSVNYHPTAIGKIGDTAIIVCGMKVGGMVTIQKWTFSWPTGMPPMVVQPSGLNSVPVALPNIQKTTIYNAFNSPIIGACGIRRTVDTADALVQFAFPNKVMKLDLVTGVLSLLATPTGGALGPISLLNEGDFCGIGVLDHVTLGYTYRCWRASTTSQTNDILLLVDGNRDGTLDNYLRLTPTEFQNQGIYDLNNCNLFWRQ